MADSRITELSVASALSGSEFLYGLDDSNDTKISPVQFARYIMESYSFDTGNSNTDSIAGAINQLNTIGTNINQLLLSVHPIGSLYWSSSSTSPASLFGGTWTQIKDKFILAAGDTYAAGATGGEVTHLLTVAEMPSHDHGGKTGGPSNNTSGGASPATTGGISANHTHSIPALSGTAASAGKHTHTILANGLDGAGGGAKGWSGKGHTSRYITTTSNGAHTHTVSIPASKLNNGDAANAHSHTMSHTHTMGNHTHTITAQGGTAHNNMPPYIAKYCWERTA